MQREREREKYTHLNTGVCERNTRPTRRRCRTPPPLLPHVDVSRSGMASLSSLVYRIILHYIIVYSSLV